MTGTPRTPWYAVAALLALAGLLTAAAAAVRWFPCLGDLSGPGCIARQSRAYNYLTPTEPWQAMPLTAVLAGLGLLCIAAAWPLILPRLHIHPVLRTVLTVILTLKPLLLGGMLLAAPVAGVLPRGASPVLLAAQIVFDLAALVLVLVAPSHLLADYRRQLLAAGGVLAGRLGGSDPGRVGLRPVRPQGRRGTRLWPADGGDSDRLWGRDRADHRPHLGAGLTNPGCPGPP